MLVPNQPDTREKIISVLRRRGPSLPVHIAKEVGLSILFTSAFLSELLSNKEIKISYMRVGNSPVYFISGQESRLENFAQHLQSKEKEAFILLKEKKFLEDKKQEPAIRVALRTIRDFAFPFKRDEEIYWRYHTVPETEFKEKEKPKELIIPQLQTEKKPKEQEILEKPKEKPEKKKKPKKKKLDKKQNEKFFNKVKEFLAQKSVEILDIENFSKNNLILRVKKDEKEQLIIVYNKKRINENDLIKASKKATELNLPYAILSFGEVPKKLKDLLTSVKNLSQIDKLE